MISPVRICEKLSFVLVVLLVFFTGSLAIASDPPVEKWSYYEGASGNIGSLELIDLGVDSSGNAYTTGWISQAGKVKDWMLDRFDSNTGVRSWRRIVAGSGGAEDVPASLAVDLAGNAVHAGCYSATSYGASAYTNGWVLAYNSFSFPRWTKTIEGSTPSYDYGEHVIFDSNGNAVVASAVSLLLD